MLAKFNPQLSASETGARSNTKVDKAAIVNGFAEANANTDDQRNRGGHAKHGMISMKLAPRFSHRVN